jgi:hypothetical protein
MLGRSNGVPDKARWAASRCPMSNGALWATATSSPTKSRNAGRASVIGGALATISSVMPVSRATKGGMRCRGFTSVANVSVSRPSTTRTAPISVMPDAAGPPPVVSRSKTTKRVAPRGRASASWMRARQRPETASYVRLVRAEHRPEEALPELGVAAGRDEDEAEELLARGAPGTLGDELV